MINAEGFTHPSLENRSTLRDRAGPIFFRKALGMPGQISGDKGIYRQLPRKRLALSQPNAYEKAHLRFRGFPGMWNCAESIVSCKQLVLQE